MLRPLRRWLFAPLVVLTLFLMACGWRNWHLSNDEEEVWLAVPGYYLNSATPIPQCTVAGCEPPPFEAHHTTVLNRWDGKEYEPLAHALFEEFSQRYPQVHLISPAKARPDSYLDDRRYFTFGQVRFQSKFAATCEITFSTRAQGRPQFGMNSGVFTLTRSALPIGGSRWRAVRWHWQSYFMD